MGDAAEHLICCTVSAVHAWVLLRPVCEVPPAQADLAPHLIMDNKGITYDLKYQARALAALKSHKASSRWIAGTNALREDNVVRFLYCTSDWQHASQSVTRLHFTVDRSVGV